MSEPQIDPSYAAFSMSFLRAVIAWNNAEASAREILAAHAAGGVGSTIAIHQLGTVSLADAINTIATFINTVSSPLAQRDADHLKHFVDGLDRLRAYRNFYVHQIRGMDKTDGLSEGLLWGLEVKGGYNWVSTNLPLSELSEFTGHCVNLSAYGAALAKAFKIKSNCETTDEELALASLGLSSLQKPTWPEKLKRTRKNLIVPEPPPESSPG